MAAHFVSGETYSLGEIGSDDGASDGAFLREDGTYGFLVSLRGKDGGAMPSPSEIHWTRHISSRLETEVLQFFFRQRDQAIFLGEGKLVRRGQLLRDGFKFAFALEPPITESLWRSIDAVVNAPQPPTPEEAIAKLSTASTTEDRSAAMHTFVQRWFGPPISKPTFAITIPRPLHALHEIVSGLGVCTHNQLVSPQSLAVADGKIIFYVENQGVCLWAFEPGTYDPPVLRQFDDGPWTRETNSLSEFLIQMLIQEAVMVARFGGQNIVDTRFIAKLSKRVAPLPIADWQASKTRFFAGNGVIGFASPDAEDFNLWLGAKENAPIDALDDLLRDWDLND